MADNHFKRGTFNVYLYLLLAIVGFKQSVLGSVAPFLRDDLGLNTSQIGWLFSAYALGIITSSQVAKVINRHFTLDRVIVAAAIIMVLNISSVGFMQHISACVLVSFMLGVSGGIIQISVQTSLAVHNEKFQSVAIVEAFVFAALGVFMGPLAIGVAAGTGFGWQAALFLPLVALVILFVAFRQNAFFTIARNQDDYPDNQPTCNTPLPTYVILLMLMILLGIATEWGLGFWGAQFLELKLQVDKEVAVTTMSVFFGGTVAGRIMIARLLRSFSLRLVLMTMIILGGAAVCVLVFSTGREQAWAALFVGGFCLGNFFPLILATANESAPVHRADVSRAATLSVGFALLTVPYTIGYLGHLMGLNIVVGFLALFPVAMIVLYIKALALKNEQSQ